MFDFACFTRGRLLNESQNAPSPPTMMVCLCLICFLAPLYVQKELKTKSTASRLQCFSSDRMQSGYRGLRPP
ncbi:hypothetical protein IEQ34_006283 [Dendrobium chrysotoxum]|uniref:Uncharacterized protein n=1 Tax=Dendrobium chrysotoxum TaxID=161865 RepID=A0AAV7HDF8_DENCH|nr:hypothetical protein IEQ34_006283 [Dendrobium chrysotoxum]